MFTVLVKGSIGGMFVGGTLAAISYALNSGKLHNDRYEWGQRVRVLNIDTANLMPEISCVMDALADLKQLRTPMTKTAFQSIVANTDELVLHYIALHNPENEAIKLGSTLVKMARSYDAIVTQTKFIVKIYNDNKHIQVLLDVDDIAKEFTTSCTNIIDNSLIMNKRDYFLKKS